MKYLSFFCQITSCVPGKKALVVTPQPQSIQSLQGKKVGIDLIGPKEYKGGYKYGIKTAVELFMNYVAFYLQKDKAGLGVVSKLSKYFL